MPQVFLHNKRRKAQQHHANFTGLVALICTGRIAERTASCYMLLLLESILSVLSCCQAGVFLNIFRNILSFSPMPQVFFAY